MTTLSKYSESGKFIYNQNDDLRLVCNASKSKSGVYLMYNCDTKELLYIGCSGHIKNDGEISTRKTGGGGLYGRIVNGHQFGKMKRYEALPQKMKEENIAQIEIIWYVTFDEKANLKHSPTFVESNLLQEYFEKNNRLPRWNLKF